MSNMGATRSRSWVWLGVCVALMLVAGAAADDLGDYNSMTEDRQNLVRTKQKENAEGEYDPMLSRIAPTDDTPYAITKERLDEIRARLMYPYYDLDNNGGMGDLQKDINAQNTQVNKQLTFLLPFFGFGLNYTWVSLNGYLGFSNAPFSYQSYPLSFPVPDWPTMPDPSFIGPFYSKCNIGSLKSGETTDQQKPGVYWRLERDLPARSDRLGVELRERIKWDVREGMVGAEIFNPKHLIIVTWKNVTFAGGYANSRAREVTNTFQLLVTTDKCGRTPFSTTKKCLGRPILKLEGQLMKVKEELRLLLASMLATERVHSSTLRTVRLCTSETSQSPERRTTFLADIFSAWTKSFFPVAVVEKKL
jgi:hypothetical protein